MVEQLSALYDFNFFSDFAIEEYILPVQTYSSLTSKSIFNKYYELFIGGKSRLMT